MQRQVLGWFEVLEEAHFQRGHFPVCVLEDDLGYFYNFPVFELPGMKIGKFYHRHEQTLPDTLNRDVCVEDEQACCTH